MLFSSGWNGRSRYSGVTADWCVGVTADLGLAVQSLLQSVRRCLGATVSAPKQNDSGVDGGSFSVWFAQKKEPHLRPPNAGAPAHALEPFRQKRAGQAAAAGRVLLLMLCKQARDVPALYRGGSKHHIGSTSSDVRKLRLGQATKDSWECKRGFGRSTGYHIDFFLSHCCMKNPSVTLQVAHSTLLSATSSQFGVLLTHITRANALIKREISE